VVHEHGRQPRVPALGELRRHARGALLARVVIDIEVLGRENAEIEVGVLDLVTAEILRARLERDEQHRTHEDGTTEQTDHAYTFHDLRFGAGCGEDATTESARERCF
jgi:hypothetical protein